MPSKKGELPKNFELLKPHSFKKGQSGNPKGRPKNRIPDLLKQCIGYKRAQLTQELSQWEIDAIERVLMTLGIKELQAVAKNDDTPAYMKTLAMATILDMKNGKTATMNLLRDRQYGAITHQVDLTSNGQPMTQSMTPDEAREMLDAIEEEF